MQSLVYFGYFKLPTLEELARFPTVSLLTFERVSNDLMIQSSDINFIDCQVKNEEYLAD
jgi:hypothetical protein